MLKLKLSYFVIKFIYLAMVILIFVDEFLFILRLIAFENKNEKIIKQHHRVPPD
jgi:hypothetical protein